jgi:membrane protease YdiL (CAAX protease family)
VDPALGPTLLKLAAPVAVAVVMATVTFRRGNAGSDRVGLVRPHARDVGRWLLIWAVWVALTEVATRLLGIEGAQPWVSYSPLVIALRILAIGVAGPIAEELAFRGIALWRLRTTPLGTPGAVVVTSLLWTALHFQYEPAVLAQVFLDGLVLGAARLRTGSLGAPIAMHITGNLFSIAESLFGLG